MRRALVLASAATICTIPVVSSAEMATYQYDVHGRLAQSYRQGGPADGTLTTLTNDPADNRSNYAVTSVAKTLQIGDKLYSSDNRFYLTLQTNGQLAVVQVPGNLTLWTSGTATQAVSNAKFQQDGNFVIYSPTNAVLWQSNTAGNPGTQLVMQNDGNLVIKSATSAPWQTNTSVWAAAAYNSDGSVTLNSTAGAISITSGGNYINITGVAITPTLAAGTYTVTWTASSIMNDTGVVNEARTAYQFTNNNSPSKSATITLSSPGKITLFHRGNYTSITYSNIRVSP